MPTWHRGTEKPGDQPMVCYPTMAKKGQQHGKNPVKTSWLGWTWLDGFNDQ
jgi:hypothetical protein